MRHGSTATSLAADLHEQTESTGVSVTRLEWETRSETNRYTIEVALLDASRQNLPELPSERVLAYVAVTPDGIERTDIEAATVRFSVADGSLTSDGELAAVSLWHYTGGKWERLETTAVGDGSYTAETPGFSLFAVSEDVTATPTPAVTSLSETTPTPPPKTVAATATEAPALADASQTATDSSASVAEVASDSSSVLLLLVVLGSLVILVSVYTLFRRE